MSPFKRPIEARSAYRVDVPPPEKVRLVLVLDDAETACEMTDLSANGAGFRIAATTSVQAEVGDRLALRFTADDTTLVLNARAVVRWTKIDRGFKNIGVEFEPPGDFQAQLTPAWRVFFNRRAAFRVQPAFDVAHPCQIVLGRGAERRDELVHDVSIHGVSIRVAKQAPLRADPARRLRAMLNLPGTQLTLNLVLRRVHETPTPAAIRIGFRFDTTQTPGFSQQQARLHDYVLERQREMLQGRQ